MQLAGKLGCRGVVSTIRPGRLFFVTDSSSHRRFLVDTGSDFSVMPWRSSSPPTGPGLTGADGRCIPCWGEQPFTVTIGGIPCQWTFLLAAVSFPILGIDFLYHHSLVVDVANQQLLRPLRGFAPSSQGRPMPRLCDEWLAAMRLRYPQVFFQDAAASSLVPPTGSVTLFVRWANQLPPSSGGSTPHGWRPPNESSSQCWTRALSAALPANGAAHSTWR
jgi:hypothetical protein